MPFDNPFTRDVIAAAIEVHRTFGPGLLESIYEKCLARELEIRGRSVECQRQVTIEYKGMTFAETLRFDLLVEGRLLVELKCVEAISRIHKAQGLSYMKLLSVPKGLILNFNNPRLTDDLSRLELC